MDNLLTVAFEANDAELNHHRRYEIRVGRDLFGDWTVAFRYGRSGTFGTEIRHSDADPGRLRRLIITALRRRLSAPRRIGCPYKLIAVDPIDGLMAENWFPPQLLGEFQVDT